MPVNRQTKLIIILGYTGTGKTTMVKQLVRDETKNRGRALIVTPDDREFTSVPYFNLRFPDRLSMFRGERRIIYFDGLLPLVRDNFSNGLLVFDDCRSYLGAATTQELHNLLIRRRQKMYDMVAVGHGFTEVPPKFFTFASHIILFRTIDNIYQRRTVLRDYNAMAAAQERINTKAAQDPHYYEIIPQ
jgi:ABC-type Mn2+/Zn2+ transport system ATPase subunit